MFKELEQKEEIHPSLQKRKIIHLDMDAFYASIEIRDNPSLQGKPVIIGGAPHSRSVVCTASYEARKYGIQSAMACSRAARLCPQAIFLYPNFEKYSAVSKQIREIFGRYTSLIEPVSLDEAYLDVTEPCITKKIYATQIAKQIQTDLQNELKLTGSVGVAPNKLIAKIASDFKKPAGLTVVPPQRVREFMKELPLRKIHGIGPVTEKRLLALGLIFCKDVWNREFSDLVFSLGENMAQWLRERSQGIDERTVETSWKRKSLGQEETFPEDLLDLELLKAKLKELSLNIEKELLRKNDQCRTITLKVKYADFKKITRSKTNPTPIKDKETIHKIAVNLLETKTEAGTRKIRLLGISVDFVN